MNKVFRLLPVCALVLAAAGCTLAPKYERPEAPVAAQFPQGEAYKDVATTEAALPYWKDFFTNEKVRKLIELGLENNRDMRVAVLNVEKARAAYGIQRSELMPTVNAGFTEQHQRTPESLSQTGRTVTSHTYQANLAMASWELDLFGRVQSLTESALQSYLATQEASYAAQNTIIAAIADAWVNVGAQKEFLRLAEITLKSQQESYDLMLKSYELGASSQLELEQAKTTVASARASLAAYQRSLAQARNSLNLLVGCEVPAELEPESIEAVTSIAAVAPSNLSSEVLLNRPDIRQAENLLKAANANIGAARANFFPRIALTGSIGTGSPDLGDLFDHGTGLWTFVPTVTLPIFTGGANISRLRQAESDEQIAVAQYEKAVQTAFTEVADALATTGTVQHQRDALFDLMTATEKAYELSESRYKNGLDGFLTVLESQRQMVSAQTSYIASEQARISSIVLLYKVLGGGSLTEPAQREESAHAAS